MPPTVIIDPSTLDFSKVEMGLEQIRQCNPQRDEMEQLTAVLFVDIEKHLVAGYKDVGTDEFWIRGHMPGRPIMPGVIICEVAAQLCSTYFHTVLGEDKLLGFGGMEGVRFRGLVQPGDRLVLVGLAEAVTGRRSVFRTQGFVKDRMVFHGTIIGITM